jgi:hypothetical protein
MAKNETPSITVMREIAREEVQNIFGEIASAQKKQGEDLMEIKEALLGGGNKYRKDMGLSSIIDFNHQYVKRSVDSKIYERALDDDGALSFYERWKEQGKWTVLEKMIDEAVITNKLKIFLGLGSFAGIISFIGGLVLLVTWLKQVGII